MTDDPNSVADRLALWQSNTEGAIADAGDLPGDLTAWSAIRRLTAQRDDLAARLSALTDAIGPIGNIRRVAAQLPDATSYSLASLANWMTAVADAAAVQPPDPNQENQQGECND